ncbi:hypothetical protein KC963_04455 [Candidatus Saccharibacteria bacterium]|nr:hypothetical protein [Candidatus Saccharibacteria bacterium]MCA9337564.1 hypothetical protein [Candidatus Saccharibacteria bacterium]
MDTLLKKLVRDFPDINFVAGDQFYWSPKQGEVVYDKAALLKRTSPWSLLHELGHAILQHRAYTSDLELIEMESQAWEQARKTGTRYGFEIDNEHIQDCMDTYRDWLHQRSACPTCDTRSLQQDSSHYRCFNCGETWSVSSSRFCRPYRRKVPTK